MIFKKCDKCKKNKVKYKLFGANLTDDNGGIIKWYPEICIPCLMRAKLKVSGDLKEIKIHFLNSLTPFGGFVFYLLFPPFILYDIIKRVRKK